MHRRILVINGHPDPRPERLCAALAAAYARAAAAAGHEVRRIDVGALDFPLIRDAESFTAAAAPRPIAEAQEAIRWCEHMIVVHPLWLGGTPALLKGFLEQAFRYGFAIGTGGRFPAGLLRGRSVRMVVTMGMPAFVYRTLFGAYGVRALERGVLRLSGFSPVRTTLIGGVDAASARRRKRWLEAMARLAAAAR